MRKKIDIPAIHDKDLKMLLSDLNLLESIEQGKITCINCSKTITLDNLFALKVIGQKLVLICDEPDCIENSND